MACIEMNRVQLTQSLEQDRSIADDSGSSMKGLAGRGCLDGMGMDYLDGMQCLGHAIRTG